MNWIFAEPSDKEALDQNLKREPEYWEIPAFATKPRTVCKAKEKSLDHTDKAMITIGTICMIAGILVRM